MLGTRLKTIPSTSSAPRFWQNNAPLQSSAVAVAFQVLRYSANLGVTMVIARLISPGDFGIFAMAVTFTGFLVMFKDGGVELALLSRGAVSEREFGALASLNCLYGLVLAGLCAGLGPALAWLYDEPRLTTALLLPAVAFLFYGLDVLPGALLLRTQRFQAHAAIETIAVLAGLSVTLALAVRGAGYWALFASEPVTAMALLAGHSWAARWRPRFNPALSEVRHFIQFGGVVSVLRAIGTTARNIDNLILGIVAGPVSLAFYSKAFRLVGLPQESINWPLSRLAIPILAQLRDRPAEFVRAFRHFNLSSVALGLPAVGFLLVSTEEIVAVLYGAQWTAVVPLVRALGLLGLCHTFLLAPGWVYTALGTVRRQLPWDIFNLAVLTAAFLIGVQWDATGVAVAASAAYAALRIPALAYCFHGTPLQLRDIGAVLWRPLLATAAAAALVLAARRGWGASGAAYLVVLRDALVFAAGYALGWVLVPGWKIFLRHELRRPDPVP